MFCKKLEHFIDATVKLQNNSRLIECSLIGIVASLHSSVENRHGCFGDKVVL